MAEKFVKMTKDGAEIEVVPSLVEEHKLLGWEVVGDAAVSDQQLAGSDEQTTEPTPVKTTPRTKGKK
jgi:hypothetical protein